MDEELVKYSKALGHPVRMRIIQILLSKNVSSCGGLVKEFSLSQATVSQHLKVLREAGLIRWMGDRNAVCYSIHREGITQFKALAAGLCLNN